MAQAHSDENQIPRPSYWQSAKKRMVESPQWMWIINSPPWKWCHDEWTEIDRSPGQAAVFYFVLALIGYLCVQWTYTQNGYYWMAIYGEHGPRAESSFILTAAIVSYWIRYIQFPYNWKDAEFKPCAAKYDTLMAGRTLTDAGLVESIASGKPSVEKSASEQDSASPANSNASLTRGWDGMKFLLIAFGIGDLGYFFYLKMSSEYRYPINYLYYIFGWVAPMLIFAALAVEVIYAVSSRYSPTSFLRVLALYKEEDCQKFALYKTFLAKKTWKRSEVNVGMKQEKDWLTYEQMNAVCAISNRLHADTTNLITSLGTITFFLAVYYGRFYLLLTMILVLVVLLLVIFLAVFPWLWINMVVSHIQLENTLQKMQTIMDEIANGIDLKRETVSCKEEQDLRDKKHQLIKDLSNLDKDDWEGYHPYSRVKQQLEIQHRKVVSVQSQSNVAQWAQARSKDVVPLTLLHTVALFAGIPLIDSLMGLGGSALDRLITIFSP